MIRGWHGNAELISETISESEISPLVRSLNWEDFASIRLEVDPNNWLEVSGNIADDGLAVVYAEAGIHYISNDAPAGISVLEETLKYYLNGDKRFTNLGFTSEFEEHPIVIVTDRVSKKDYEDWKVRYEALQWEEKRIRGLKKVFLLFAAFAIIVTIPMIIAYAYHYEYQFSGHDTALVMGDVMDVEEIYYKENLIQRITYYFDANGKRYKGYFLDGAFQGFAHKRRSGTSEICSR